jgi:hypothetical protein
MLHDSNIVIHGQAESRFSEQLELRDVLPMCTQPLVDVSLAFVTDAFFFFMSFRDVEFRVDTALHWPNLRTLSLTSTALLSETKGGFDSTATFYFLELMTSINRAVKFIPKLELLEIWNGVDGEAFVFRYVHENGIEPYVEFCTTANKMYDGSLSTLEQVHARMEMLLYPAEVRLLEGLINRPIRPYADVLPFLKLRPQVVDPISDFQIRQESEVHWWRALSRDT